MDIPKEKMKPHEGHLEYLEVITDEFGARVECTQCCAIVATLYEPDNYWTLGLKAPNLKIGDITYIVREGGPLSMIVDGEEVELEPVYAEKDDGKEFICMQCHNVTSADKGCADHRPYWCDDCTAREMQLKEDAEKRDRLETLRKRLVDEGRLSPGGHLEEKVTRAGMVIRSDSGEVVMITKAGQHTICQGKDGTVAITILGQNYQVVMGEHDNLEIIESPPEPPKPLKPTSTF